MSGTVIEDRWLERVWDIFHASVAHLVECQEAGGAADSPSKLFPGYLGTQYPAEGGLLCLGLAGGFGRGRPLDLGRLRSGPEIAGAWIAAGKPPTVDPTRAKQFLDEWCVTYLAELPRWEWWRQHFDEIVLRYMKIDLTEIAIGNVAACHMSEADRGNRLAKLCDAKPFPLAELLDILRPKVILATGMEMEKGRSLIPSSWPGLVRAWPAARPDSARAGAADWRWKVAQEATAAL